MENTAHPNRTIGFLATWLDGFYQSELWRGAVEATRKNGNRLIGFVGVSSPGYSMSMDQFGVYALAGRSEIEGILLSSGPLEYWKGKGGVTEIIDLLKEKPMISLGVDYPNLTSITPDGKGMEEIVLHLIKVHQCRSIAYVSGPENNPDAEKRFLDFKNALRLGGIPFSKDLIIHEDFCVEGGERAILHFYKKHWPLDAIVFANDAMALGALKVLGEKGVSIPDEILITGFDDTPESRFCFPPLTTVSAPICELGIIGTVELENKLNGKVNHQGELLKKNTPLFRLSCGCIAKELEYNSARQMREFSGLDERKMKKAG